MATRLKPGIAVPVQHSGKETVQGVVYKVEPKGHILMAYTTDSGEHFNGWADPHPDNPALWVPIPPAPEPEETEGEDEEDDYYIDLEAAHNVEAAPVKKEVKRARNKSNS